MKALLFSHPSHPSSDGTKVSIEADVHAIHGKNQVPLNFSHNTEVLSTSELLKELNALIEAGRHVSGKGYIRIRTEKGGRVLSEQTSRFVD